MPTNIVTLNFGGGLKHEVQINEITCVKPEGPEGDPQYVYGTTNGVDSLSMRSETGAHHLWFPCERARRDVLCLTTGFRQLWTSVFRRRPLWAHCWFKETFGHYREAVQYEPRFV